MFGVTCSQLRNGLQEIQTSGIIHIFMPLVVLCVILSEVLSWARYFGYSITAKSDLGMGDLEDTENLQRTENQNSRQAKRRARKTNGEKKRRERAKRSAEAKDHASTLNTMQENLEAAEKRVHDLQKSNEGLEKDVSKWKRLSNAHEAELVYREDLYTTHRNECEARLAHVTALAKQLQVQVTEARELGPERVASIYSPWSKNFRMEDLRVQIARHEQRAKEVDRENKNKLREKNNEIQRLREMIDKLKEDASERSWEIEALWDLLQSWEPIITKWRIYCRIYHEMRNAGYYFCRHCLVWHHVDHLPNSFQETHGSAGRASTSIGQIRVRTGRSSALTEQISASTGQSTVSARQSTRSADGQSRRSATGQSSRSADRQSSRSADTAVDSAPTHASAPAPAAAATRLVSPTPMTEIRGGEDRRAENAARTPQ
jgi:hypothetical protein